MASETATQADEKTVIGLGPWQAGAIGGIVGGIAFGAMMTMDMRMVMEMAIPGMYGFGPSLELGWLIHLFHSVVFGLIFVAIIQFGGLEDTVHGFVRSAIAGVVYGLVIWIIAASFLMPAWVNVMMGMGEPVPNFMMESAIGHAVFGILLGAVYGISSSYRS